jgi:sarcosine oxidase subunit alpha
LLAAATGRGIAETGTIRARPPVPVAIGAFGGHHRGRHFRPTRQTASHGWSTAQGATFVDAGQWKRAQWFARLGETSWRQSTDREVMMTRGGVGICDVSTLGKIELIGPDVGAARPALRQHLLDACHRQGALWHDAARGRHGVRRRHRPLCRRPLFMTTTTANAARVMQHVDFARQVLWPDLDAQAVSVTEQWATYAVAGPASRQLLADAFPISTSRTRRFPIWGPCRSGGRDGRAALSPLVLGRACL